MTSELVRGLREGANHSRILLALDGIPSDKARSLAEELRKYVAGGKANDLIDQEGAGALHGLGFAIRFLDPKIHDIANTVKNRLAHYHQAVANIVTVHAAMSRDALRVAANAGEHYRIAIVAVTLLTDISSDDCHSLFGVNPEEMVRRLTIRARDAGLHGIVCSPKETKMVRRLWPEALIINPGVRLPGSDAHDQARVGTPEQAIKDGADLLVVGRDITDHELHSERLRQAMRYNEAVNNALAFA